MPELGTLSDTESAALVASPYHPILKLLSQRFLLAEKPQKLAITVLMRKLILLANRL